MSSARSEIQCWLYTVKFLSFFLTKAAGFVALGPPVLSQFLSDLHPFFDSETKNYSTYLTIVF